MISVRDGRVRKFGEDREKREKIVRSPLNQAGRSTAQE
jgi:hypothetical protein